MNTESDPLQPAPSLGQRSPLPLAAGPAGMEPALRQGGWLVLLYADWIRQDRQSVRDALSLARTLPSGIRVAVRPFANEREHARWLPDLPECFDSRIWVLLRDGSYVDHRSGKQSRSDLVRWASERLGQVPPPG